MQKLTDMVKEAAPAVVEEMTAALSLGEIQKVLQNLVREQVPVRDLVSIFESLADYGKVSRSVDFLTERVRESLARLITLKIQDESGVVTVATLSPNWEQKVKEAVDGDLMRGWQFNMDPREVQKMMAAVARAVEEMSMKGLLPVLLVHPDVRLIVRRILEASLPTLFVISYNEIAQGVQLKSMGWWNKWRCVCDLRFLSKRTTRRKPRTARDRLPDAAISRRHRKNRWFLGFSVGPASGDRRILETEENRSESDSEKKERLAVFETA